MANKEFSVLDMAQDMADTEDLNIAEFFRKNPVSGNIKKEMEQQASHVQEVEEEEVKEVSQKRKPWTPPEEVMEELPELKHEAVTFTKAELQTEDGTLRNIADDNAKQSARDAMDELRRKQSAIEDAKLRHGIKHFQIPEGPWHVRIHNAAIDVDYRKAQSNLDEIFNEIKRDYPEFIYEWLPGYGPKPESSDIRSEMADNMIELPEMSDNSQEDSVDIPTDIDNDKVEVKIDKTNVSQISWTQEEMEKIRKARTVELNIIEGDDLVFSEIEDVSSSAMDEVLSQYTRKTNDVEAPLPASRYRATFIGLSYPEVLDLNNSNELNSLDGERAKWTIAYNHIRNQSIGPWQEYKWYIDKDTKKKIKIGFSDPPPKGYTVSDMHVVTKFDDFLMKTSWIDLEFILWKILCATAMDKEIITVECHANVGGKRCNHSYDWVYSPNELLDISTVNPAVLEEMKTTTEAMGEEIMKNYYAALLHGRSAVQLPHNKFQLLAGHISAYEYLDHVYSDVRRIDDIAEDDPNRVTSTLHYTTLSCIKGFLLPKKDGSGWYRITGSDNIVRILHDLDEVDWQAATEVVRMMMEPYQFKFSIKKLQCPKCGNKSELVIRSIQRLLFIVARSLSTVQIELKRN